VAHHGLTLKLAPPHNLCGTKPLPKQGFNRPKLRRPIKPVPPRSSLSATRFLHRMRRPIVAIMHRTIPLHLPIQRAPMPPKMFCDLSDTQFLLPQRRNRISFLRA
jgi:hypothetical protein